MKLLNAKELSAELGISAASLWRLRKAGVIPRIRGCNYYNLDSVRKALEQEEYNEVKGRELISAK